MLAYYSMVCVHACMYVRMVNAMQTQFADQDGFDLVLIDAAALAK